MATADRWEVTVLLGSRWADLASHNTRWKRVLLEWVERPEVASVSAVDFPHWAPRRLWLPSGRLLTEQPSWHPGIRSWRLVLPLPDAPAPWDDWVEARLGRALRHVAAGGGRRLVVAANPLVTSVARHSGADVTALDAVDDWRDYAPQQHRLARIERGYGTARRLDRCTAVSAVLSGRLAHDVGVDPVVIPNGAPSWPDDLALRPAPPGTPTHGFAVYVGAAGDRLDLDALADLRRSWPELPVVLAGSVDEPFRQPLERLGVTLLGPLHPDDVPALLARATVGLVPHRDGGLATSQSSMKLLEYVAAGLPVATTRPEPTAPPGVATSTGGEGYGDTVRRAVAAGAPSREGLRTWSRVADELWEALTG